MQECVDGYWTAALTKPNAERRAADALDRRGFPTVLPLTRSPLGRTVLLIPGYLFVYILRPLLEVQWSDIVNTFGVRRMLVAGDRPAVLDPEWIDGLRAEPAVKGVAVGCPFLPGAPVRIAAGPFAECEGVFIALAAARARSPPGGRAICEVSFFRRITPIEVDLAALTAL